MKKIILKICYAIIGSLTEQEETLEVIDKTEHYSKRTTSSTGYKGVAKRGNKYQSAVDIKHGDKGFQYYLGMFDTPEQAYDERIKFIDSLK